MVWLVLGALVVLVLAKPLVTLYRSATPTVVEAIDAAHRTTAFDADQRALLAEASFGDHGAHLIRIGGAPVVLHLWQRPDDGTAVVGLCLPDGTLPAHYVATVLAEGRGWLETRTTDRTPGPREELMQVVPGADLAGLVEVHDRALTTLGSMGVATVRSVAPFEILVHQGDRIRRSLRHNPPRWLLGLAAKAVAPDRPSEVGAGPALQRRLRALRLA